MRAVIAPVLLGVFFFVAVFGLPMLLSHSEHHVGCPLQGAQTVMCESTIFEHFSIWQTMFASFITLFVFVCVAFVFGFVPTPFVVHTRSKRLTVPERPPLMQELYSRGILNRKEPSLFS